MSASIENFHIKNIIEAVQVLKNMYDVVRVVDPVKNTVIYIENRNAPVLVHENACYAFWKKGKFCDNCISLRAIKERDTFVKFEVVDERIYMVTASPVEYQKNDYVIETLNDITDKGILESMAGKNAVDFTSFVLRSNDALVRDELTQIFNRRYINERLPVEIFNSIASSNPATLVIVDIDKFKNLNDTYGHIAGDVVLQQFARLLAKGVQSDRDWVARYGGEEFLFYFHNIDGKPALELAEGVRKMVADAKFTIPNGIVRISCSLGICTLKKGMSMQEWIDHADKKLYVAKAHGGNRVIAECTE